MGAIQVIIQLIIGLTGCLAILLTLKGYTRVGSIVGIIGQPFWLIMSYINGLWGVFVVSIAYLIVWVYGFLRKG